MSKNAVRWEPVEARELYDITALCCAKANFDCTPTNSAEFIGIDGPWPYADKLVARGRGASVEETELEQEQMPVSLWTRVRGYYQRRASDLLFKRAFVIKTQRPLISFSFDDFPESALGTGGAILKHFDLAGTYYASLGLIDQDTSSGRMFGSADLKLVCEQGHELGCHTFSHCHSGNTATRAFEQAIIENRSALRDILPSEEFRTFSYPISCPRPLTKLRAGRHFLCCRGGGQVFNVGTTDLNNLAAYFLEKSRHKIGLVKDLIDRNRQARGWLIFATHDISDNPTPYGCTPGFFEDVIRYAVASGACILPVVGALEALTAADARAHSGAG